MKTTPTSELNNQRNLSKSESLKRHKQRSLKRQSRNVQSAVVKSSDQVSVAEKIFVGLTAFACAEALGRTIGMVAPSSDLMLNAQRITPGALVGGLGTGIRATNKPNGNAIIVGGLLHIIKNYI